MQGSLIVSSLTFPALIAFLNGIVLLTRAKNGWRKCFMCHEPRQWLNLPLKISDKYQLKNAVYTIALLHFPA